MAPQLSDWKWTQLSVTSGVCALTLLEIYLLVRAESPKAEKPADPESPSPLPEKPADPEPFKYSGERLRRLFLEEKGIEIDLKDGELFDNIWVEKALAHLETPLPTEGEVPFQFAHLLLKAHGVEIEMDVDDTFEPAFVNTVLQYVRQGADPAKVSRILEDTASLERTLDYLTSPIDAEQMVSAELVRLHLTAEGANIAIEADETLEPAFFNTVLRYLRQGVNPGIVNFHVSRDPRRREELAAYLECSPEAVDFLARAPLPDGKILATILVERQNSIFDEVDKTEWESSTEEERLALAKSLETPLALVSEIERALAR